MASDANVGGQWERVAAELRACREAQQRAWGEIDNTTLGRYLAGEVTSDERHQIESALHELPELRKLTELVRDVLGECEVVSEPASLPYGPATVPFAQPQTLRAVGLTPRTQTAEPAHRWGPRMPATRFRQRAGLVTAATVLLALSVALPRSGTFSPSDSSLAMSQPVALHGDLSVALALDDRNAPLARLGKGARGEHKEPDMLLAQIDASVQALEAEGRQHEAKTLARQYADNLTRKALCYQEKGDLARAEPALNQVRTLCAKTLGAQAPETVRTRHTLAGVYEYALNSAPSSVYFLGTTRSPSFVGPAAHGLVDGRLKKSAEMAKPSWHILAEKSQRLGLGGGTPVRVSSAYEPDLPPSNTSFSSVLPSTLVQQTAGLVLRERLTSQSPSELKVSVVPVLTQALREANNGFERQRFAQALGQLGPAARESVPVLLDCYRQATETPEQTSILLSLGQIGPVARQAVPVVIDSLRSDCPEVRDCAAQTLVEFGTAARPAVLRFIEERPTDPLPRHVLRGSTVRKGAAASTTQVAVSVSALSSKRSGRSADWRGCIVLRSGSRRLLELPRFPSRSRASRASICASTGRSRASRSTSPTR